MAYKKSNANGQATMANSEPVVLASDQASIPVTVSGVSTAANQTTGNASLGTIAGAVSGTEMQVDVLTMPTTTVTATDLDVRNFVFATDKVDASGTTLGANSGVDIGDVTINNAAGASAVNIQDGGNSITIDAPVTTPAFVRLSDGAAAIATLPVSAASLPLPSGAATSALQSTQDTSINTLLKPASTLSAVTTVSTVTSLTQMNGQAISMGTGVRAAGTQRVTIATDDVVPASQSGTWTVQPGNTANTTAWLVNDGAAATGGYTPNKLISAATTNATVIKASAGTLGYVQASNINASPRYLKFYNKATSPTVGTDTPVHVWLIPGNSAGAGTNIPIPSEGVNFSTGISFAITTGAADADTGAVAASEIIVNYGTI